MRRPGCWGLLILVCLLGCGPGAGDLPAPGAEGPVRVRIWPDGLGGEPTRLEAHHIRAIGSDLQRYRLSGLQMWRPLDRGLLVLAAPQGTFVAGPTRGLTIDPPVALSGWLDGLPCLGQAAGIALGDDGARITLEKLHLALGLQDITAERLVLDQGRVQADHWAGQPDDAPMVSLLGTLPQALAVPASAK